MRHLQISDIKQFGSTAFDDGVLTELLRDYDNPAAMIQRMVKKGDLIRLRRGLYCVAPKHLDGTMEFGVVANSLYGPSYVSFETALSYYGIIPERVYRTISAVTGRSREYRTPLTVFEYQHIDEGLFSVGVKMISAKGGNYLMASPTKALCDTLMRKIDLRISSPKTLRDFLETDMRVDFEYVGEPDREVLHAFATCGRKPALFRALERMFV